MEIQFELAAADCTAGNGEINEQTTPSSNPGYYIDPGNQVPCTGQLTAWNYCFYEPASGQRTTYNFRLQVRRLSTSVYRLVGEEVVSLRRRPRGRFRCFTISLDEGEYIDVQRGDVLGVFLDTPLLSLVAASESSAHRLLFAASPNSNLGDVEGRRIHLSVDISE
jgi:hypothetical protein